MKYLIILLALASCYSPRKIESRNCVYHNWGDSNPHCNKYRVVSADRHAAPPPYYFYR